MNLLTPHPSEPFKHQMTADNKLLEIMETLKAAKNLQSLTLEFHSSYSVRLSKSVILIVSWAVQILQLKKLRLSFTRKSLDIDGFKIGYYIYKLEDHLRTLSHPCFIATTSPMIFEWSAESNKTLVFAHDLLYNGYHDWWISAYVGDRLPILGARWRQDTYDDVLRGMPDDGNDEVDYAMKVLIPYRTRMDILKSQTREAGRRITRPVANVRRCVSREVHSRISEVRKLFRKNKMVETDHGRVRQIII
jgi:hypothetical protein